MSDQFSVVLPLVARSWRLGLSSCQRERVFWAEAREYILSSGERVSSPQVSRRCTATRNGNRITRNEQEEPVRRYSREVALLVVLVLCGISWGAFPPVCAAVISGTPGDDVITVTAGLDCDGVTADGGNDTVTVESGAEVRKEVADSRETATAAGVAVDVGEGANSVYNFGLIRTLAEAIASIMDALGSAAADADADATGVLAADGVNTIINNQTIDVDASAQAEAVNVSLGGLSPSEAEVTANATSVGVEVGAGTNAIDNESLIDVDASSTFNASGITVGLAGYGDSEATTDASGITVGLIGYAPAGAEISTEAEATGIAGGDGELDIITNTGTDTINVLSEAYGTAGGVSVNLAGAAPVTISTTAVARATGIDGQGGTDLVFNEG